ncbi:MAG TPA: GDSL-type esterase/lipase family protein [Conexibacter sp.]|jgi:lysophospholipase L1-like esterase|nr:GDSL-type esterase/lipase family protein [Conexibacter sp.]
MFGIRRLAAVLVVACCLAALTAPSALAAITFGPDSMAATGASATTAYNTCAIPGTNCPANSWSTGTNATVNSIYLRILATNAEMRGHLHNDAVAGRKMAGLQAQFEVAAEQRVELVTVDMGSNDICTDTEAEMTSVESFSGSFDAALALLTTRLPNVRIAVASIPNVHRLWRILHEDAAAVRSWNEHTICQSILANPTSTARVDAARRNRVLDRITELNLAGEAVCAEYVNCRDDGGAAAGYAFEAGEISTNDYFHPSIAGQTAFARTEWEVAWEF